MFVSHGMSGNGSATGSERRILCLDASTSDTRRVSHGVKGRGSQRQREEELTSSYSSAWMESAGAT